VDYSRPLLKVNQVAARLGITERDVYKLIKTNQLHAFHLGRMIRIHEDDLAKYLGKFVSV
jgi:excisionase family DNA binding protein